MILDYEGFRYKKAGFIIKELSLCSINFSDTIVFLPTVCYNSITKFFNGLSWNSGTYLYRFLSQMFVAIKLLFQLSKFYAKGKQKTKSFHLLMKKLIDLETVLCSKVQNIKPPIDNITCALHSFYLPEKQKRKPFAKRKSQLYLCCTSLPSNEPSSGEGSSFNSSREFISNYESMQLHNERKSVDLDFIENRK